MSQTLLLLFAFFPYVSGISLTSSPAQIKAVGQSVRLSCQISGYALKDYGTAWIRHPPGKAMEWIGIIWGSGSIDSGNSFKSRFTISRDTGKNELYLDISSLQTEDTAVYYCARRGMGDFDYWGRGTQVTVTNETPTAPVVFKMSQCNSPNDSLIIGCLASKFSPDNSVNFRWSSNGNEITNVIQHSTANKQKFSYFTITKEQRDQSKITCTAEHPLKTVSETFSTGPTLGLVLVPTEKNTFVMCVIEDFYPETITVQWKENDTDTQNTTKLEYKLNMNGLYTALSLYKLNEIWNENTKYTCEVSHEGKKFTKKRNFRAKFTLMLKPPIEREMFIYDRTVLEAVVSGDLENTVKEASVSCEIDNVQIHNVSQGNVLLGMTQYVRTHNVTVNTTKWRNGGIVTCTTRDTLNDRDIKQEIHVNKGDGQKPSVTIYKPDEINTEDISLVCEVSSTNLGDVYIMWKINNTSYIEGKSSGPIQQQGSTSVLSILTISKEKYENSIITCAVKHAKMKEKESPLLISTSKKEPPEPEPGFALHCNEDVLEEDEFRSLWSTATSFIFLFLFSLIYSAVLSLFKMKQ